MEYRVITHTHTKTNLILWYELMKILLVAHAGNRKQAMRQNFLAHFVLCEKKDDVIFHIYESHNSRVGNM